MISSLHTLDYIHWISYPTPIHTQHPLGSYFGGAIKRPQFPTIKGRILGRKQDTTPAEQPTNNNTRSNNSTIKEGGSDTVTPAKTAAWDAWSTVNEPGEEGEPVEVAAAEPLASSWMTTEDTGVCVGGGGAVYVLLHVVGFAVVYTGAASIEHTRRVHAWKPPMCDIPALYMPSQTYHYVLNIVMC